MHNLLAKALAEKGVLTTNCEITAKYFGKGMDDSKVNVTGILLVKEIKNTENSVIVYASPVLEEQVYVVEPDNIVEIDGMEPRRIAAVYGLKPDGSSRHQGKKRGRKTQPQEQMV